MSYFGVRQYIAILQKHTRDKYITEVIYNHCENIYEKTEAHMRITSNQVLNSRLTRVLHGGIHYINCPGSGRVGKLRTVMLKNNA